ncbi:hypothetical protein QBC34DRAFT_405296 [Podospora aff. communis PSN243]|uniref:Nucleoporin Nup159/Nup146 N-terminal domain-containing protein n=1 Tax=Podospora aff. communis PSN243 TaxID=3040156 RepID=A0AAV9GRC3_9PEZI|nr:hypothetical protein QBC34DRAFT_405296 [Podospora aff. communis PSN243]
MAFGFGNSAASGAGGLTQGPDLEVIQTEGLGFNALSGEAKVQLASAWSPPPAPTASLISIAPHKGLVAAAGPDAVHISSTESVRKAFETPKNGGSEIRPFTPQAKLSLPFRLSQLAFTADEQFLVLSAETGGGLAVYDVQAITQGVTQAAFELSTNGETLRALVPNPMPESAAFCALVTNNGSLFMANLAQRKLVSGPDGPVLRSQVTCAAWSTKGKQLVAGMGDGSVYQMTADGTEKAHIPKPPSLGEYHVSTISWLENHMFLVVHNPTNGLESAYHIITRQQPPGGAPPTFTFQKLTDPVDPFGSDKVPHQTVLRIKDFPPNLQDLLIISSTATDTIGLLTRSKTPLASDKPAETITNVFTMTELADDSRRAQVPMSEDYNETFPIGITLDLSSKEKVFKPIPTDEIEESPGPVPGLWVLNNEGVLSSWWVIYNESIRSGTTYPGMATGDVPVSSGQAPAASTPKTATFGSPAASAPSPFGAPAAATPAFGGASALGLRSSPWSSTPSAPAAPAFGSTAFGSMPAAAAAATPTFGQPAFGSKPAAPAFGQSSVIGMGAKASPWASASTGAAAPAFGQSGFASASPSSGKVFGSTAAASPSSGGFANFASKGGFASLASTGGPTSVFGSKPSGSFATSAPEVSMETSTSFPPPASKENTSTLGSSPFVLGTTFKADPKTANDNETPKAGSSGSLFGSGFGLSLSDTPEQQAVPESKDEDMDSTPVPTPAEEKPKSIFSAESTTPITTPAPQRFGFNTTSGPAATSNLFGSKPAPSSGTSSLFGNSKPSSDDTAAAKPAYSNLFGAPKSPPSETPKPALSNMFGASKPSSAEVVTPKPAASNIFGAPKPATSIFGTPKIKQEDEDKENLANIPEAPLPPDTTTSSTRVKVNDAPLPPDFVSKPLPKTSQETTPPPESSSSKAKSAAEAAPLPPDFTSSKPKSEAAKSKSPTPESAPLPPDFVAKRSMSPLPTVPAAPESPGEFSEEDQEDEDEEEEEEEEGESGTEANSEGSGIDVAKDLSPTTGFGSHTPGFTPQSSFGQLAESGYSTISRSEAEPQRALFGEISRNAPPLYPKHHPTSPRSPSPVRGAVRHNLLRPSEPHRSVSAPGAASMLLGRRTPQPPSGLSFGAHRSTPPIDPNVEAQRRLAAARKEAEERVLVDPEDEGIQKILQSTIEPTLQIHEFLAVDSKLEAVDTSAREEVPAACETLWRDINRMIDRLGLNSRSLESFIRGHSTQYREGGRHKEDLESPEDWVLVEAEELGQVVENDLAEELEEGRVKDIEDLQVDIQHLARDLAKLRAKGDDLRKVILAHVDPDQAAATRALPLSAEQATQQNELRRAYATFSKLLGQAEEALTMLKAKIATAGGASGKAPVPTIEAIIRTINKMTSMAEKRSGDIDVLENQMRRLRFGSMGLNGSPTPSRSREGSPFATPQKKASIFSPDRLRDSIMSSPGSYGLRGTPPRKKLSNFTDEEKKAVKQKDAKRKATLQLLRASLQKTGPNVSRLRDDD